MDKGHAELSMVQLLGQPLSGAARVAEDDGLGHNQELRCS